MCYHVLRDIIFDWNTLGFVTLYYNGLCCNIMYRFEFHRIIFDARGNEDVDFNRSTTESLTSEPIAWLVQHNWAVGGQDEVALGT